MENYWKWLEKGHIYSQREDSKYRAKYEKRGESSQRIVENSVYNSKERAQTSMGFGQGYGTL